MNQRELLLCQMSAAPVEAVPNWEFGFWETTLPAWQAQGLPREIDTTRKAFDYFGVNGPHANLDYWPVSLNHRLCPAFETVQLGRDGDQEIWKDGDGVTFAQIAAGDKTIPHYLDYPLKGRKEWEELFKPRLNPLSSERAPAVDWPAVKARFAASGYPVCLYMNSYMGWLRNLMGFEEFAMLPYTDAALFEEMVETLTQIKMVNLDRVAGKIRIDYVQYWEDICFKNGPIVHPEAFRTVVLPRMKRVNDRLRDEFGCRIICVDSDGDCTALLDGWVAAGVTALMPCEVDAGMDINLLQQRYGARCGFMGGIQKKALAEGEAAIRLELERVRPAVRRGGYLPHLDHLCPSNVPLAGYECYLRLKKEILGCV